MATDEYGCYLNPKRAVGGTQEAGLGCCNAEALCTSSKHDSHVCRLPCELDGEDAVYEERE